MKKRDRLIFVFFILLISSISLAQEKKSFKGKITYTIEYMFYDELTSNFQLMEITGNDLIVYYSDGKILNLYPGGLMEYAFFSNAEKRSYQKFRDNDTIYYVNTDVRGYDIRDYEIVENSAMVLNNNCNSMLLYFETGPYLTWEETFAPELYFDPANASNYSVYNYNFIYKKTKAIPLKTVVQNKKERIEYMAVDIYTGDDKKMFSTIEEMIRNGVVIEMR